MSLARAWPHTVNYFCQYYLIAGVLCFICCLVSKKVPPKRSPEFFEDVFLFAGWILKSIASCLFHQSDSTFSVYHFVTRPYLKRLVNL